MEARIEDEVSALPPPLKSKWPPKIGMAGRERGIIYAEGTFNHSLLLLIFCHIPASNPIKSLELALRAIEYYINYILIDKTPASLSLTDRILQSRWPELNDKKLNSRIEAAGFTENNFIINTIYPPNITDTELDQRFYVYDYLAETAPSLYSFYRRAFCYIFRDCDFAELSSLIKNFGRLYRETYPSLSPFSPPSAWERLSSLLGIKTSTVSFGSFLEAIKSKHIKVTPDFSELHLDPPSGMGHPKIPHPLPHSPVSPYTLKTVKLAEPVVGPEIELASMLQTSKKQNALAEGESKHARIASISLKPASIDDITPAATSYET